MGEDRRGGSDRGATDRPTGRRLTVPEAAEALGITADAVRSRIKRGTLETKREGGRVFVVLVGADWARPTNAQATTDQTTDPTDDLREQVRYLREQLRREQDAHEQTRRLLGGALERIPAIEAPQDRPSDAPGPPETTTPEPEGASPRPDTGGAQEAAQRPWWRRLLGG